MKRPELDGLAAALNLTKAGLNLYGDPLKIAARLKNAEKFLRQKPIAQDDISRSIVQALAIKGTLNISAITRQVASVRGKASRRIIRERLKKLEEQKIVLRKNGKPPTYELIERSDQ